jgi:hypothetical protein
VDRGARLGALALGVLAALFAMLMTWRDPMYPGAGLDPSWILAAEFAARKGLVYGRDFIFTFGPYHYLVTRMFDPQTFPLLLFYDAFAVVAVFWVAIRNRSILGLIALAVAFVFLHVRSDSLIALSLFAVFLIALQRRDLWGFIFVVLASPLLLAKLSFILVLLPLVMLADLERAVARRVPYLALALLASLFAAYVAAGQPAAAVGDFVASIVQVIGGYGAAMQIEGPGREIAFAVGVIAIVVLFAAFLAALAWRGERRDLRPVAVVLGAIWVLFVLFKMGFVRQDGHILMFHAAAPVVLVLVWSWFDRPDRSRVFAGVFAVLFAVLLAHGFYWQGYALRPALDAKVDVAVNARAAVAAVPAQLRSGLGWATGRKLPEARMNRANAEKALMRTFPASVSGSVDAIPLELSEIIASGLDYRPRPTPQSYQANTPWLQEKDRAFLQGPRAPDTLFLRVEDIDGRLPTLSLGPSAPVIAARYDAVDSHPLGLILKRRASPRPVSVRQGAAQTVGLDQWATLPPAPGTLVMARIEVERTLAGRLMGVLFREPVINITLRTASGREAVFRFIPGMAQLGFPVSPLPPTFETGAAILLDPGWAALGEPVTGVKLSSKGGWAYGEARIAFDEVRVAPGFGGALQGMPLIAASLTGSDPRHAATFNGTEIFAHAPTVLKASIAQGAHLKGVAGLHPQPPGTKPGNGVRFIVTRFSPTGTPQVVLDAHVAANAPPVPFDVQVEPGGALQLETRDESNSDYDWSYWGQLELAP